MSTRQRIDQQPAYVLHSYPWRETSLIVEVFSRDHGRVALVAKGARRPHSAMRGVLMAFQPLLLDWSGGGEVKTLVRAEWQGGQPLLSGKALLCGYYLNELLVKLSAREDAHPKLFVAYADALRDLACTGGFAPLLRRFELALLGELGYTPDLSACAATGAAIEPAARYRYLIEHGPVAMGSDEADPGDAPVLSGQSLIDLSEARFDRSETLAQGKALLRALINHYLHGQELQSRRVLTELQGL